MSIFDKLKKEEGEEKKPKKEEKVEKKEKKESKPKKSSGKYFDTYKILKEPHVTEKATDLTDNNQYIFKVFPKANKIEIKRAVEDLYDVNVVKVRIVNVPAKPRRLGRTQGEKSGYKKAIVRIKEGQTIELLPK